MNKIKEFSINFKSLVINNSEIADKIGYGSNEVPAMVIQQINELKAEIGDYCEIKGGFKIFNQIGIEKDCLSIEDRRFDTDKIITDSLKKVDSMAVFVCTAGKGLSEWVKQFFKENDAVKAYIADIIASLIVEKAMDQIQNSLAEFVLKDEKLITNRYSPGYCGWNVSEQHKLFSLLPENFCGVRLNEAALMNPIKSVSGIIGIGNNVRKAAYQCNKCEKTDCLLADKHA